MKTCQIYSGPNFFFFFSFFSQMDFQYLKHLSVWDHGGLLKAIISPAPRDNNGLNAIHRLETLLHNFSKAFQTRVGLKKKRKEKTGWPTNHCKSRPRWKNKKDHCKRHVFNYPIIFGAEQKNNTAKMQCLDQIQCTVSVRQFDSILFKIQGNQGASVVLVD